ncbi:MAG: hypothetical protein ACLTZY_07365 [Alistipes indistinctus]
MNLEEHLSAGAVPPVVARSRAARATNYFTFNIPEYGLQRLRPYRQTLPQGMPRMPQHATSDYLTRVIGYMKRVSNFSQSRQVEAAERYYGHA